MSDGDLDLGLATDGTMPGRADVLDDTFWESVRQGDEHSLWTVWIPASHPASEVLRAAELERFPEAPSLFGSMRGHFTFIAVVSCDDRLVHHAARLLLPELGAGCELPQFLSDVGAVNTSLTDDAIWSYYRRQGARAERLMSVETNFRVAKGRGALPALAAYESMFRIAAAVQSVGVLAHMNRVAAFSFRRLGLRHEPIAGIDGLATPDGKGGVDPNYEPVMIPADNHNLATLARLAPEMPPIRNLDADVVSPEVAPAEVLIDLRDKSATQR
ncbi:MAG: hypothetical protein OEW42_17310 [Acidimicrobiia bacterium]|nr:hypothetical protein [Acidimicrobiia bacterium]